MSESRRIKDALLERYLAGALEPEARAQLDTILAESGADRARLVELRADTEAFLVRHPPGPFLARFEADRRRRRFSWILPAALIPVAAAAAALLLVRREPDFAVKGDVVFVVHKKEGEASVPVQAGSALAPGDSIRFDVRASGPGFVAVVGRDASGEVTAYYPFGGPQSAPYHPTVPLLPGAVALDASIGHEELFAIYARETFDLAPILNSLRAGRPIAEALPPGASVAPFAFEKK